MFHSSDKKQGPATAGVDAGGHGAAVAVVDAPAAQSVVNGDIELFLSRVAQFQKLSQVAVQLFRETRIDLVGTGTVLRFQDDGGVRTKINEINNELAKQHALLAVSLTFAASVVNWNVILFGAVCRPRDNSTHCCRIS